MLKPKHIAFLLFLAVISAKVKGQLSWGASINYTHIVADTFEVNLIVEGDCNWGYWAEINIDVKCGDSTKSFLANLSSGGYVPLENTGLGIGCKEKSRCVSNGSYGILKRYYTTRIALNWGDSCEYEISANVPSHSVGLSTVSLLNNYVIYTSATINKCAAPTNSSAQFEFEPSFYLAKGDPYFMSNKATDPDGDLLTYSLETGKIKDGEDITYKSPWAYNMPITFLSFPSLSSSWPRGFWFDSLTGNMAFVPMVKNQEAAFCIKVTEWRNINGVLQKVGDVYRNFDAKVTDPNSKRRPSFKNPYSQLAVCKLEGTTVCKDIPISFVADSVYLEYTHNLANITFTNVGTIREPIVRVCYTPTSAEIALGRPLQFSIKAWVNSCPFKGVAVKTFEWVEKPPLPDSFLISKELKCRTLKASLINNLGITNPEVTFTVQSANQSFLQTDSVFVANEIKDTGWYKIQMRVSNYKHCGEQVYSDSIYVPEKNFFEVETQNDTTLCFSPSITLSAKPKNGKPPYSYRWKGDITDTLSAVNISVNKEESKYFITLTDAENCVADDSITVKFYNPSLTLSGDSMVCAGDTFNVRATLKDTLNPTYGWVGLAAQKTTFSSVSTQNNFLLFSLKDGSGCVLNKYHFIRVYAPQVDFKHHKAYCESDSIVLEGTGKDGLPPYTILWQPYNKTATKVPLGYAKKGEIIFTTIIKDGFGCKKTQTEKVRVLATPDISYHTALPNVCENDSAINLSNYVLPVNGIWTGSGIEDNTFHPLKAGIGKKQLTYLYVDSFSYCSNEVVADIAVHQQPQASFTVDSLKAHTSHVFSFTNTSKPGSSSVFKWNFGDPNSGVANTSGKQNANHQYTDTGRYTVKLWVSSAFCKPDSLIKADYIYVYSEIADSNTTALSKTQSPIQNIYPNPARNNLFIEAATKINKVVMYDILGKAVSITFGNGSNKTNINTQQLQQGFYTVVIQLEHNELYRETIIIAR